MNRHLRGLPGVSAVSGLVPPAASEKRAATRKLAATSLVPARSPGDVAGVRGMGAVSRSGERCDMVAGTCFLRFADGQGTGSSDGCVATPSSPDRETTVGCSAQATNARGTCGSPQRHRLATTSFIKRMSHSLPLRRRTNCWLRSVVQIESDCTAIGARPARLRRQIGTKFLEFFTQKCFHITGEFQLHGLLGNRLRLRDRQMAYGFLQFRDDVRRRT